MTNSVVTWNTDNAPVATIDNTGLATTLTEGTANITATYRNLTSNPIPLTVTPPELTAINISPTSAVIYLHHNDVNKMRQQFTANGTFSNNSSRIVTQTVDWSSSDTNRATMDTFYKGLAQRIYIPNVTTPGKVTISAASDAATCNPAELNVECREYVYYNQGNYNSLPSDILDHHVKNKTIAQVGCALTATTMVISTTIQGIDPRFLNNVYSSQYNPQTLTSYGYQGQYGAISWLTIENFTAGYITISHLITGLGGGNTFDFPLSPNTVKQYVDQNLNKCEIVIVGVRRMSNQASPTATHYIIITGKTGNTYNVLDPADPANNTLGNREIYQIITYHINN